MPSSILAGVAYFAIVFAVGFLLGTTRVLLIAPAIGDLPAVALDLPLMVTWSWLVSRHLLRRFADTETTARLTMGLSAFALLMLAEFATFLLTENQPPLAWLIQFRQPAQLLGLAGQVAFALLPLIR